VSALRYTVLFSLLLTGCANAPDSYAPPIQRKPIGSGEPSAVANFVNMGDLNAGAYIVRDIADSAEAGTWRWTGKRPELRFHLDSIEQVRFKADFAVAEATMKSTGPVTITVFVNGNLLERIPCAEHGEKSIDKPVPREFLRANAVNIVAMEIDKVYIAGADGVALGFILTRAGFTQ
jgi:hypothetical protein